jgi:N-acetylmuramoyl-L-alanine amidase
MSDKRPMMFGLVYVTDRRRPFNGAADYAWRELGEVERIIIHHSATAGDCTVEAIAEWHTRHNGWPGIGYHFLVHPDGRLEYVGDIAQSRYHVGDLNRASVGVCLAGDFSATRPTHNALMRTRQLITNGLWLALGRRVAVVGHRDVWREAGRGPTSCPGETWEQWRAEVGA